jgi:hypothetical protein
VQPHQCPRHRPAAATKPATRPLDDSTPRRRQRRLQPSNPSRRDPNRSEVTRTAPRSWSNPDPISRRQTACSSLLQPGVRRGAELPERDGSEPSPKISNIDVLAGRNANGRLPRSEETAHHAVGTTGFEPATP